MKGYPCGHALAVTLSQRKDVKDLVKPFFTLEYFASTYAGIIIHPHNIDFATSLEFNSDASDESETEFTHPPNTRHAPGRPKKRRIRTGIESSEGAPTRVQKCGRCRASEHSVRICKERI